MFTLDAVAAIGNWFSVLYITNFIVFDFRSGRFFGSGVTCFISTMYGRRPALLLTQLSMGVGYFTTLTENFKIFVLGIWIINFGWYGLFQVSYLYLMEIVGFNMRIHTSIKWFTLNSLIAQTFLIPIFLGEIAAMIIIWKTQAALCNAFLCLGILSFSQVFLLMHLPETPKWLLTNLKPKEAERQLNEMAAVNGKKITVEVELAQGRCRVDTDGATLCDLAKVKFGGQEPISLEKRDYPTFTVFNLNLLPVSPSWRKVLTCISVNCFSTPLPSLSSGL